ncbi:MAG TPA: hypothetical protein VHJ82_03645 [Actinomycetota bacterium]|nr:hypothetical protein [Actinomycetota bacterium]
MVTIKATCPVCGEVKLTADDIVLRMGAPRDNSSYAFSCPSCQQLVEKPADDRIVRLLLSGGVMPSVNEIPAEALEAHYGAPIDYDDLIDFHQLLQTDGWFEQLLQGHHS